LHFISPADHAALERSVHPSQRQPHIKPVPKPLHVVVGLSNPMRYASRYRLYDAFRKYVADSGAILTTVELALGDRHFEVTHHDNPRDLQLRSDTILWQKEDLLNAGIRHLTSRTDPDAEYIAWIDSDVIFTRPDWATETVHLLQTYDVVQMWTHSIDLGPDSQPIAHCTSFVSNWQQNEHILQPWNRAQGKAQPKPGFKLPSPADDKVDHTAVDGSVVKVAPEQGQKAPGLLHTGYAWAARRDALESLGGLGDIGILGSGDRHMAYALIGEVERSYPNGMHPTYRMYWDEWQNRAEQNVRRNIGAMNTTLMHYWHGSKQHRRYQDRWQILTRRQFNWMSDVRRDSQGLWTWTHTNPALERDVRQYFAVRNEDSVDL
jgi:glycosyltransferase involved in cell wall biosynthesis